MNRQALPGSGKSDRSGGLLTLREFEREPVRVMRPPLLAATVLFLLASFAHFSVEAGIAPFERVALAVYGVLILVGAALALLLTNLGRFGQAVLLALLFFAIADLHVPGLDPLAAGVGGLGLGLYKPRSLARLIAVIFLVVLLSAIIARREPPFEPAATPAPGDAALPPLLHVMLDEIGPETGLPSDRFSTWSNAHSRYHTTKASLPETTGQFYETLLARGYALEVVESSYADVCPAAASCSTYRYFHFDAVRGRDIAFADQVRIAAYGWIRTGELLEKVGDRLDRMVGASHVTAFTSLAALDRVEERAADLGPGEALSVHLLLPHYPYSLDRQCDPLPYREWVGRSPIFPLEARRNGYREQLACITGRIAQLGREDMVIVVHGDHGTRFFDTPAPSNDRTGETLKHQAFDTAFAVQLPGVPTAARHEVVTVSSLLEALASGRFDTLPEGRDETVIVRAQGDKEVAR